MIPEAFFRDIRNTKDTLRIFSGAEKTPHKRCPIGVYDSTILCVHCEATFNDVDNYGIRVLLKERATLFTHVPVPQLVGGAQGYSFATGVDQNKLLRFFIGVLWRASVSSHDVFKNVQLGPHEEVARQVVLHPDAPIPDIFGAALGQWKVNEEPQNVARAAKALMSPFSRRLEGINFYRFCFGGIFADIKVDKRPFPTDLMPIALGTQTHLITLDHDFLRSSIVQMMSNIARRSLLNDPPLKPCKAPLKS